MAQFPNRKNRMSSHSSATVSLLALLLLPLLLLLLPTPSLARPRTELFHRRTSAGSGASASAAVPPRELNLLRNWRIFKLTYGKLYGTFEEELKRFRAFVANFDYISKHNAEEVGRSAVDNEREGEGFALGLNEYSDMDNEEFKRTMNGFRRRSNGTRNKGTTYFSPSLALLWLPDAVDWRKHGLVTPVKNQGQCGSCWAFSSTGSLEGQMFKKNDRLVSLSEQNLVDCSTKWGNSGCNGGEMDNAFAYVKDNGGLDTEESYPYEAEESTCRYSPNDIGATVASHVDIPEADEQKLMEAVASVGPVAVAVDASHPSFQHYSSGVYKERHCSAERLDHGVLVIGYGTTESGDDYWLVKNSWGTTWGEEGYIKMSRNSDNQCGIASSASYPLV